MEKIKISVEEHYYKILKKKWKAKLLELWHRYGTNPIPLKDFKDDKNMRDWISGHFWRWGLLKRVKRGVYAFSSFGVKCVDVLKRQAREEAMWSMKKEYEEGEGKFLPYYEFWRRQQEEKGNMKKEE